VTLSTQMRNQAFVPDLNPPSVASHMRTSSLFDPPLMTSCKNLCISFALVVPLGVFSGDEEEVEGFRTSLFLAVRPGLE